MMFDANTCGLPQGQKFFVEVHQCDTTSVAYSLGIREGMVMLAEMAMDAVGPCVQFNNGSFSIGITEEYTGCSSIVYAGSLNEDDTIRESSFIDDDILAKAHEVLKKAKHDEWVDALVIL